MNGKYRELNCQTRITVSSVMLYLVLGYTLFSSPVLYLDHFHACEGTGDNHLQWLTTTGFSRFSIILCRAGAGCREVYLRPDNHADSAEEVPALLRHGDAAARGDSPRLLVSRPRLVLMAALSSASLQNIYQLPGLQTQKYCKIKVALTNS